MQDRGLHPLLCEKLGVERAADHGFDIVDGTVGMCACLQTLVWTAMETGRALPGLCISPVGGVCLLLANQTYNGGEKACFQPLIVYPCTSPHFKFSPLDV